MPSGALMLGLLIFGFCTLSVLLALGLGRWFKFMRDVDERDEWGG